jgi:hypothetical protein
MGASNAERRAKGLGQLLLGTYKQEVTGSSPVPPTWDSPANRQYLLDDRSRQSAGAEGGQRCQATIGSNSSPHLQANAAAPPRYQNMLQPNRVRERLLAHGLPAPGGRQVAFGRRSSRRRRVGAEVRSDRPGPLVTGQAGPTDPEKVNRRPRGRRDARVVANCDPRRASFRSQATRGCSRQLNRSCPPRPLVRDARSIFRSGHPGVPHRRAGGTDRTLGGFGPL